jgi:hypothetical protein
MRAFWLGNRNTRGFGLRQQSDGADFDDGCAQLEQRCRHFGALVDASRGANGIGQPVSKDIDGQVTAGIVIAALSGIQAEAVQRLEHACAGMMRVFAVGVDLAQGWHQEPFVDARARVGDVEVAKGEAERQGGAQHNVLGARAGRAYVGCVLGSDGGLGRSMSSCEVWNWALAWAQARYRGPHSEGTHMGGRVHGSERLVQPTRRSMAAQSRVAR